MANVTYNSKHAVTLATRDLAYQLLALLMDHLDHAWSGSINLVSITVNADHTVTVVLTGALPAEQVDHLGLVGPV